MALFNQSTPGTLFADTPDLLPYATPLTKRSGKPTGFKKALDWLLPVVGATVGTAIAPGIGTKLGASLGSAATGALNRNEHAKAEANGATDALQNIDNSLAPSMLAGNVVNMASGLLSMVPGSSSIGSELTSVDPTADATGVFSEGALQATGITDYRTMLNSINNTLTQAGQATAAPSLSLLGKPRTGGLNFFAEGGIPLPKPKPKTNVVASDSTAVARPVNPLDIPVMLPEVTVVGKRNNNPFEAAGSYIGQQYVEGIKADPRYKTSPWSVGSPTDIIDPLLSYPGQVLDQATHTSQNAILKPSSVVDALTTADLKVPMAVSLAGGALLKKSAPALKQLARNIADPALEAGLRSSRVMGAEQGWSAEQIAKHQFDNFGITDNQRKAYIPLVSDVLSARIHPFGYQGVANIKHKLVNQAFRNEPYFADRFNAWDLYLGKPQRPIVDYEMPDAAPLKTFSYLGQKNGEDILRYENYQVPKLTPSDMDQINAGTPFVKTDTGGVMGGYGIYPMGNNTHQYRDRWDLDFPVDARRIRENLPFTKGLLDKLDTTFPNLLYHPVQQEGAERLPKTLTKLRLEHLIGKPFQSKGDLKLNSDEALPYLTRQYAGGGKPTIDYRRYLAGDPTEDLLLVDKKSGQLFGAMRYGERIFDQSATDAIDAMVKKLRKQPTEQDFSWLGKFVFDETLTHKDNLPVHAFQDGGRPKRTPGSTNVSNSYAQGILAARAAADQKRMIELQAYAQQYAVATNPIAKARLKPYMDELAALTNKMTQSALPPAKTQSPITLTQPSIQSANKPVAGGRNRSNQPAPKPTPQSGLTVNQFGKLKANASSFLPNPADDAPLPQFAPALPINADAVANSLGFDPKGATTYDPRPSNSSASSVGQLPVSANKTGSTNYDWLNTNNILNAGRIVGGIVAADTPYPDEVSTRKFDWLVSDAEGKQHDGLSPAARRFAIDNLADNRSTGYEALRRSAGGGASSGAVLAGIGQIGQTEVAGDVALGQADEQQRVANQMDYRGLLGAQMDIANQRFNRQFNAVQATRQAGLNLIPQGLQGITDDHQTWKAIEDPNSPYQRYFQSQINKENELAEAAKRIYGANTNTFLAPSSTAKSTTPRPPLLSAANTVLDTPVDYRTLFNVLPSSLTNQYWK